MIENTISCLESDWTADMILLGLLDRSKRVDLADIVDQSEQPPLYIHFQFRAQGESIHALLHADIGKNRFNDTQPPGIDLLALMRVNLGLHLVNHVGWLTSHLDRKIPARRIRLAQATCSHGAGSAIFFAGLVNIVSTIAVCLVVGMTSELLTLGANVNLIGRIKGKISGSEEIIRL